MELVRNHVVLDNLHMLYREYAKNVLHLVFSAFLTAFVLVVIFPRYTPICLEKVVWLFVPMDISQITTIPAKNVRATVYIVVGAQITALNAMETIIFSVIWPINASVIVLINIIPILQLSALPVCHHVCSVFHDLSVFPVFHYLILSSMVTAYHLVLLAIIHHYRIMLIIVKFVTKVVFNAWEIASTVLNVLLDCIFNPKMEVLRWNAWTIVLFIATKM